MPRARNPNRELAFKIYREHHGDITTKEIAAKLNEKVRNITYWKKADNWTKKYNPKGGAPEGNQNAVGNNGGAPHENQNARKNGWYSKYFPTKSRNLIKEAEEAGGSPLEILWAQILTQWIAIIRAQKIMYVEDKEDKTKELRKIKSQSKLVGPKDKQKTVEVYREEEYEIQQAWEKQANFLNAQSRAMTTLTRMIKKYDEMLHANWDIATEEQKLRVERLKTQIENPELQYKKQHDKKKLGLQKERFEHQKKIDEMKVF